MKLIIILAVIAFLAMTCSPMQSQSSEGNESSIRTDTTGSPLSEATPEAVRAKEWAGGVGGNYFVWDGKDLNIRLANGRDVKAFSEFARNAFREQVKDEPDTRSCDTRFYYRPLAIVGNLLTFQTEWGMLCGAITTYSWGYSTIELTNNGKFLFHRPVASKPKSTYEDDVYMSELFPENDIFKGLLANEKISNDISKLINQRKIDKPPENLTELKKLFERFPYDFLNGVFDLDSDSLEVFAIHHVVDDKVSVWISLTPSSHAAQALQEHIEIFLPIPENLRDSLLLASSGKGGFLMNDAEKYVGTSYATYEFGVKK
jgi:hypothetical protein